MSEWTFIINLKVPRYNVVVHAPNIQAAERQLDEFVTSQLGVNGVIPQYEIEAIHESKLLMGEEGDD